MKKKKVIEHSSVILFFLSSFIYFEKERETEHMSRGGAEREKTESPAGSALPVLSLTLGLELANRESVT